MIDKKRFPLLRKAFDLMLTGAYTSKEVLDILNNEWGYTSRKRRNSGGKPMAKATWYKMLTKSFYAGKIVYKGKETQGKHIPLISLDEHKRILELAGQRTGKRRPQKHTFVFAGIFSCGFCGGAITAEHKYKYIKSEKFVKGYDYYHCTHNKKELKCNQRSVLEQNIIDEIDNKLKTLEIHPKFLEWGLEYLDSLKDKKQAVDKQIDDNIVVKEKAIKEQMSGLTTMRAKGLLDDDEYLEEKQKLKQQLEGFKQQDLSQATSEDDIIDTAKEAVMFAATARAQFLEGDIRAQRNIVLKLGSNQVIMDKKVLISVKKWLLPIYENADWLNAQYAKLEPTNFGSIKRKNEAFKGLRLTWLEGWDSNPRPIGYTNLQFSLEDGLFLHPRHNLDQVESV